ncbi:7-carboxy-7-deazaguanine synthase [Striga asiatica]|uniref:7-carboxy-7-deazaguanine synthase n=1 Tax=Striga asiatica TaxID=4170 RepID=A0A5A7RFF6_STRAF|nr:7-carboxy-7-deazaguanine synthase [Striga asiatica]
MKAIDQEVKSGSSFDCGSVNRKPGPNDDTLAASSKKQAVSNTDIFEEEVKSGSAAKRKVEPDDASLVASVAKKPATYVETSDADATIGHNVEDEEEVDMDIHNESFIEFRYICTLGRKDEVMEAELAKRFVPGSKELNKALKMARERILPGWKGGNGYSDEFNSREVCVKAAFLRDGSPLLAFML